MGAPFTGFLSAGPSLPPFGKAGTRASFLGLPRLPGLAADWSPVTVATSACQSFSHIHPLIPALSLAPLEADPGTRTRVQVVHSQVMPGNTSMALGKQDREEREAGTECVMGRVPLWAMGLKPYRGCLGDSGESLPELSPRRGEEAGVILHQLLFVPGWGLFPGGFCVSSLLPSP